MKKVKVIKKDSTLIDFDKQKIKEAVSKAALRAIENIDEQGYENICNRVLEYIEKEDLEYNEKEDLYYISVFDIHCIVENVLGELYPKTGHSYTQYRNYKIDFVKMMDKIYQKEQEQRYIGDVSNANTDSTMVSTQRSLSYGLLSRALYRRFFLNEDEREATRDGYIYIHDDKDRRDAINCCLADITNILNGGFEMGNIWYSEPNSLDVAFDVISDIVLSMASQQYGGYTIPEVDKILNKYAEKSYQFYCNEYKDIMHKNKISDNTLYWKNMSQWATDKVRRDFEQGFQGWEYKFNTVASSRGDYPFIAMSFGIGTSNWEVMASRVALQVRKEGQGKKGKKKPVLFPKLTFLYDEELHGENKQFEWLFNEGIECTSKTMYPDFLSLTGDGYIPSIYKKYGIAISLMGCRASLSPWFIRGGMYPTDEDDDPVFVGRFNIGAISLNLPMILAKSRQENKDFYEVLNYYLEMIRNLHKRTYNFLGEKKASTNPLGFMEGGFYGGNLKANDKIKPLLKAMTASFGITALNETQQLYNNKSIYEDGEFALEIMQYINDYVNRIKDEDQNLYAIYGTPAESLAGKQVEQFRKKYGIIENVSDRDYVSNSFHCHVSEDITPIEKQDSESRFYNLFNGGKIQYCKYPVNYNHDAIKVLIRRAMDMGFYEGVNLSLAYCEHCGHQELDMDICPNCGSDDITQIERMNGYIGYKKIRGKSRFNKAKMIEFSERVSM